MRSASFSKTSLFVTVAAVAMIALASGASAQTGQVDSSATARYEDVSGEHLPGGDSTTIVYLDYSWGAGGYNPTGVTWTFELQYEAPEWATVTIQGENPFSITPSPTPSADGVDETHTWQIGVDFSADAPNGTTDTISWTIVTDAAEAGTIKAPSPPSGGSSTITMQAIEAPTETETGGNGGGDGGDGGSTEEGPAPLPALFVTGTLAALAVMRRRQH